MFSKAILLLLLAASVIAGPIAAGTYLITNVASQSAVRVYNAGTQIYVSSSQDNSDPFQMWILEDAENGGYTINNVGLGTFAAVRQSVNGEPVITDSNPTVFYIESADDNTYEIKLPYESYNYLAWNVESPVVPSGAVALRSVGFANAQAWTFTSVSA